MPFTASTDSILFVFVFFFLEKIKLDKPNFLIENNKKEIF